MAEKSNLPDMKEITTIASKLFVDIKKSVKEIITDYKEKRTVDPEPTVAAPKSPDAASAPKEAPAQPKQESEEDKK